MPKMNFKDLKPGDKLTLRRYNEVEIHRGIDEGVWKMLEGALVTVCGHCGFAVTLDEDSEGWYWWPNAFEETC